MQVIGWWIALMVGLIGTVLADGASGGTATGDAALRLVVSVAKGSGQLGFTVNVNNPGAQAAEFLYDECDFSYQLSIAARVFRFPSEELFAFGSPCPGKQIRRRLEPGQTAMLFFRGMRPDAESALRANRLRFTGEFHFRYVVRYATRFTIAVYRI